MRDDGKPDVILIGTGSEVSLCLAARDLLAKDKIKARVVSMPCRELFDAQDEAYRESVLPPPSRRASRSRKPRRSAGTAMRAPKGIVLGMDTFGLSAPLKVVSEHFGFTPERVAAAAKMALGL